MIPEQIHDLTRRAEAVHPDEPVATAREVLDLIETARTATADAAMHSAAVDRVRGLGEEWIRSRDIQQAAHGRLVLAAIGGRQAALTGLI
ncbi:hypothetical protein [Actinomadura sp. WAC 06369]|uniref:hypothetical protein n=1 Tax=Actinomadura sp. WAC 06369 TaxID=2203193 RepID=UPI000F78DDEE|nr:hypothetical protein [Actinomadura sp. WAC 06369]RSN48275.1 hypothetical protein DMH08_34435 [Actinomadura sp. WAC 06369]